MSRPPRFIIKVSGSENLESALTHCEAWCRCLQLFRSGVTVTCTDTEIRRTLEEEQLAARRAGLGWELQSS